VRRNAVLLLAARVVSAATTLAMLAVVARLRGADAVGVVGVGFAIGAIAAAVSDAGLSTFLVREASRQPARTGALLGLGLAYRVVSIPVVLGMVLAVANLTFPSQAATITLVAAGLVVQYAAELTRAVFNARQQMIVSASHTIVENLVWLAVIVAALGAGLGLEAVFALALAALAGSVVVGLGLVLSVAGARPERPTLALGRSVGPAVAPFAAFAILGIAYARLDPFLVATFATGGALAAAGTYFAASRIIAAFEYLPEAFARAIYPELSIRSASTPADVAPLIGSVGRILLVAGLAVPASIAAGGDWLINVLLGSVDPASAWVVGALSLVVPIRFLGYLLGTTLTSADAQGRRVAAAGFALVLVAIVDVTLIPRIGIAAPVLGAILASTLISGLYARSVAARFGTLGFRAPDLLAALAAAAAAAAVGLILRPLAPAPIVIVASLAAYVALILVSPMRTDLVRVLTWPVRRRDLARPRNP
jgi:O-antigen/teichoic acid export membrane protein